jgi:hypothetical protein
MKMKLRAIAPITPPQTLTPGQKALRAMVERYLQKKKAQQEEDLHP